MNNNNLYVEAPNHIPHSGELPNDPNDIDFLSIFLAGGITNCPDWQSDIKTKLKDINIFHLSILQILLIYYLFLQRNVQSND